MFIKKIFKNSEGDTIIEVLLSIAVISLVLVISYGLSSKDSQYIQQSQEHGEAQKISEQQLELLRDYLTPDTDWTAANYICFKDNVDPPEPSTNPGDCNKGADGRYHTRISVTSADTYTVHTNWSSLTEVADQSLDLSYKLPVSALAPVGLYPECDDTQDNDGDHKVDFPTDPGCTSLADNDETDPPPVCLINHYLDSSTIPPTCKPCPAGFTSPGGGATVCTVTVVAGSRPYQSCVGDCAAQPGFPANNNLYWLSGGADTTIAGNVLTPPGSPASVTYQLVMIPSSSTFSIKLTYFNGISTDGNVCHPPPPGYSYHIKLDYPGGSVTGSLPISSTDNCSALHTYTFSNLVFVSQPNPKLKISWDNDYWRPGVNDSNFGLYSITYNGTAP